MISKVLSVTKNKSNPRYPDSTSYSIKVEDEERTIFSPNYCPEVGSDIEYELAVATSGNSYFRIVLSESEQEVADMSTSVAAATSRSIGGGYSRKMLPPLSPAEAVSIFKEIAKLYAQDAPSVLADFSAEQHQAILVSLFIAATKPREYFEEITTTNSFATANTLEETN